MKTTTTPNLKLGHICWPMFIEELTGGFCAFTDTLFLSMISDSAAASVGMLGPVMLLGFFILPQFTSAGTSVASQYYGAGREDKVVPAWIANLVISTALGLIIALAIFFSADRVGLWFGMGESMNVFTSHYLSIIAFNFVIVGLRFSYSSILASKTLTRWNMVASVTTNLINIPLNWALMKGFWIIPAMGVRGIALATVISFFIGFLILFYLVHFRLKVSFFIAEPVRRVKEAIAPILKIGIPAALEPFSYTVQSFFVSYLIVGLGLVAMGANTYVNRLNFIDMTVSWVLTMGGQIIMSYHLGAGRIDMVNHTYRRIARIISSFAFVNMLIFLVFHRYVLGVFSSDPEILGTAFWLLLIALFMEPIRSINILGGVALKTVGDGRFSVIMGLLFMWGIIPVIVLMKYLGFGIVGIWVVLLADETIRASINLWRWMSGRWRGKTVIGEGV